MNDELAAIFDRIANGQFTEADIASLQQFLESGDREVKAQFAKFNVNIGEGRDIHIGDRIYQGIDVEATREIVRSILKEKPQNLDQPENYNKPRVPTQTPKIRHILLGFAVDVSGSMKKSIRNQEEQNGFKAFLNSLKDLSKKVNREIEARHKESTLVSVDVFAQAFGLKEVENCDLLTLIEFGQEFAENPKSRLSYGFSDPYYELMTIARRNGVADMYSYWIEGALPDKEQANRLAIRLNETPCLAAHLARLLPKEVVRASIAYYLKNSTSFWKYPTEYPTEYLEEIKQLEKAKALALEIANASSRKEILQIVIREVGSQLGKELSRRGNRLASLTEVADLLEYQEKGIENIEPFIYANTPMCSALKVIQQRFREELTKLPQNTISVLFILSDGEPTDGDPIPFIDQLEKAGTYVISCFLTNQNIPNPRKLFDKVEYAWSKEAKLMFYMASKVDRDSVFVESLIERKWEVSLHPTLFVQANHTYLLNEFTQIIVSLCKEKI